MAAALISACNATLSAIATRMCTHSEEEHGELAAIAAIGGPGGRGYDGKAYASTDELDWDVTELMRTLCCTMRALGCVGQCAVAADDVATAIACCDQLLKFATMAEDPGHLLPSLLSTTAVQENAAHALLRLAHTPEAAEPCWALPMVAGAGDGGATGGHGARIVPWPGIACVPVRRLRPGSQRSH